MAGSRKKRREKAYLQWSVSPSGSGEAESVRQWWLKKAGGQCIEQQSSEKDKKGVAQGRGGAGLSSTTGHGERPKMRWIGEIEVFFGSHNLDRVEKNPL